MVIAVYKSLQNLSCDYGTFSLVSSYFGRVVSVLLFLKYKISKMFLQIKYKTVVILKKII